jgi:hypothetical protein
MDHDEIREHIKAAAARGTPDALSLISRLRRACWPGGSEDRTQPGALPWVRQWHPVGLGATLSACSCASGRCVLCN